MNLLTEDIKLYSNLKIKMLNKNCSQYFALIVSNVLAYFKP